MKRLIIRIEVEVGSIDRAKVIKEAVEVMANDLSESTKVDCRYDETTIND